MAWKSGSDKPEKLAPWIIGAAALAIFAVATYINYGNEFFRHSPASDVSAAAADKGANSGH